MSQQVITVDHVSKSFRVYYDRGHTLKELFLFQKRNHYERREILRDISFGVEKGEAVGVIGHNGCGKSTLLKLLTRIMYPDEGSIHIQGRVACLIELGAGFHPDMSGRENIYINASIFGLTRKEIDSRLNEIIDFSELGEFIDNPVRTYSSGMYMRLAFSVAINVNADVLLVDEILAVGDEAFQKKCFKKMQELKRKGVTILMVTHNLEMVKTFCDRAIWIHDGVIHFEGAPKEAVSRYLYAVDSGLLSHGLDRNAQSQQSAEPSADLEQVMLDRGKFAVCVNDYHFNLGQWVLGGYDKDGKRTLMPNGVSYGPYISLLPGEYIVSIETEYPELIEEQSTYSMGKSKLPLSRVGVSGNQLIYYQKLDFSVDNWEIHVHSKSTEMRIPFWNFRVWRRGTTDEFSCPICGNEAMSLEINANEETMIAKVDHLDTGMYLWNVDADIGLDLQGTVLANAGNISFKTVRQPESENMQFLFVCPMDLDRVEFHLENSSERSARVTGFEISASRQIMEKNNKI